MGKCVVCGEPSSFDPYEQLTEKHPNNGRCIAALSEKLANIEERLERLESTK